MKGITRERLVAATAILLAFGAAGMLPAQESDPAAPADPNVTYPGPDGARLHGYLATPDGTGPFPAVLMIHEWWGLNRDTARLADALAAEGYVVLAPDTFRGSVATTAQEAIAQLQATPQEQIAADVDAALAYLRGLGSVDAERVASMGFCFGGTQSMFLGTRARGLAAVVTFYGSGPIQSPDALGRMADNAPVLGIFGREESNISVSEVNGFEAALNAAGVENTITIYDGVGHAFVKSTTYDQGGAATDAWNQLLAFLASEL